MEWRRVRISFKQTLFVFIECIKFSINLQYKLHSFVKNIISLYCEYFI